MVARAGAGELVDLGEGPYDLAGMRAWTEERTVRAAVLRHLLITEPWPIDAKGVRLRGVRISGLLDLEAATVRCPLWLDRCYVDADEPICLDQATTLRVTLTGCQLPGVTGEMLTTKELDLSGSTLVAPLRLARAEITGQLACRGARLAGTDSDGSALVADGLKAGDVFLDEEFTAAGAVRLTGADITGQFLCRGARLAGTDSDGSALVADGLKAGDVFLDEEFTAAGAVRLTGADITGQFLCRGARLAGTDSDGSALVADGLKAGDVFLDEEFTAAGAVRLTGADITGQLSMDSAQLTGTDSDGNALAADGMTVGGDVFLGERFTAAGTVSLASAHVGASVYLMPTALADENEVAFSAAAAQISGTLHWVPDAQIYGQVNLEGASVGQLEDNWSSERPNGYWPANGRLRLDGFTYGRFSGDQPATAPQRLAWIRSQYASLAAYASQPYSQLERVYRRAGKIAKPP